MGKAFLSHSSRDKILVEAVARKLGEKYCICDTFSFECGQKTFDEIIKGLDDTDLFVLFLSDNSLNSEWVKKELSIAYSKLQINKIKRIFPIIIDEKIDYTDSRIPEWLSETYNLQRLTKSDRIQKIIRRLLKEILWEKSPHLKEKNTFFCGRNILVEKLESEFSDFDKNVNCFVASGFSLTGRKALMKYTLQKLKIIPASYTPITIKFKDNESIEDFIKMLFDLGIIEFSIENFDFINSSQKIKVNKLVEIIKEFQKIKEVIFINDFGGIILPNGEVVDWFKEVLQKIENKFIFGISSKFNLRKTYIYKEIANVQVKLLDLDDRKKMFSKLLTLEGIDYLSNNYKKDICNLFTGYPVQIRYAVELIKENPKESFDFFNDIIEYNYTNASKIFNELSDEEKSIVILIAYLEIIEKNFLYEIVTDDNLLNNILSRPHLQNIFEYSGGYSDYINISENIQDFIVRSNFKISDAYEEKIRKSLEEFKSNLKDSSNYTDVDHTIVDLILTENSDKDNQFKFILPSHYLKTIIKLYKKRNYKQVIAISKKILESEDSLDEYLVKEIRKYMCLALAREKDKDNIFTEVAKIKNDADQFFIKGLYYRQIGKYNEAFENQCKVLELQSTYTGAQREIVQIYTIIGQVEQALVYAKKLYEGSNKNNPYTIQGYLLALIKTTKNKEENKDIEENKRIIEELLEKLKDIGTDISGEMQKRAKISYEAFVKNDSETLKKIKDLSIEYEDNHYIYMEMFDIADRFNDYNLMKESIDKLKALVKNRKSKLETVIEFNEIIFKKRLGNDVTADLATIKSKIPKEIYHKLKQRISNIK